MRGENRHRALIAAALALVLCLAAILRVWGMGYGLPHPTARPDEEKIVGRDRHPQTPAISTRWGTPIRRC